MGEIAKKQFIAVTHTAAEVVGERRGRVLSVLGITLFWGNDSSGKMFWSFLTMKLALFRFPRYCFIHFS